MKNVQPIAIDLFCGVGGLSLGFEQAGFHIAAAVDNDRRHVLAHTANFPSCTTIEADLHSITGREILLQAGLDGVAPDVVIGGPPCQGFSEIGRRRLEDPRNGLIHDFARLVGELRPKYFVLENVEGLLAKWSRPVLRSFLARVRARGYAVVTPISVLDAANFGVPQRRRRAFILGFLRGMEAPVYPEVSQADCAPTVWDAIGDLPEVELYSNLVHSDRYVGRLGRPSEYVRTLRRRRDGSRMRSQLLTGCARTAHTKEVVRRFTKVAPGSYDEVSHFFKLDLNGIAPTQRAGTTAEYGKFMAPRPIHPTMPRCITLREAARLHSFPDWFVFDEVKWHGFRQVGNSVPPLLARAVADETYKVLVEGSNGRRRTQRHQR